MKLRPVVMKLSEKTGQLLKNFSTINQSILFKQGSKLRTISVMKNILAEANIEEEIPKDFGIYDLTQFLNGLALHDDPDLDFTNDSYVIVRERRSRSKYFFADANVIITPPEKAIELPSEDVSFQLSTDQLDKLVRAAGVYQLPDLSAIGGDGVVKLVVRDKKNDTSNDFAVIVGETDKKFVFNFKIENIKIPTSQFDIKTKGLPSNYNVVISRKLLSRFTSEDNVLTYYIALEPDSTFEE